MSYSICNEIIPVITVVLGYNWYRPLKSHIFFSTISSRTAHLGGFQSEERRQRGPISLISQLHAATQADGPQVWQLGAMMESL